MSLAIYCFSIALIIPTILKDSRIGIFYFLPLLPLTRIFIDMHQYPMGKDIVDIMLFAIIAGWMLQGGEFVKTKIKWPLFFLAVYTFFELLNGFSYLGTSFNIGDFRVSMWKTYMIMPLLFFIVLNNIKDLGDIKKLIFIFSVIYLAIATSFVLDYEDTGHFSWDQKSNYTIFAFLGANHVASFMVINMSIFAGLYYFNRGERIKQIYFLAASLLGAYNVIFLFSRAAYLAMAVIVLLFGVFKDRRLLIGLAVIFLLWNIILPRSVVERISPSLNSESTLDFGREEMWDHAYALFKQNPIIGIGYNTFRSTIDYEQKETFKEQTGKAITDTHSLYYNTLAEMGIIGIGLLFYLFFLAIRSGWKLFKSATDVFLKGLGLGFFISVIACMITNAYGDRWSSYQLQGYYWMFWALVERGLIITEQGKDAIAVGETA